MSSRSDIRRAQVFGISLTEMMLILLFIMFLIAKNALDGKKDAINFSATCGAQLKTCQADLSIAKKQLLENDRQLVKLKQWVATLMASLGLKPLSPSDPNFLEDAGNQLARAPGGVGKPSCLSGSNYLLELQMEDGFVLAQSRWNASDEGVVSSVPAISALVSAGRLPFSSFSDFSAKISSARSDCLFTVLVTDRTTRKETYKPQLLTIERHFRRRVY